MRMLNVRLFLAILVALILTIIPLPGLFLGLRPPWVLLIILYTQFFLADNFHLILVLIMGLVLDSLLSTVIGEHAFALTLVSWMASSKARRFNFFSMGQQMFLIGFLCFIYQFLILIIDAFQGYHLSLMMCLGSAVITVFLWPWVRLLADRFFSNSRFYARQFKAKY